MSCGTLRSAFLAIALSASLSACESSDDTDDRAESDKVEEGTTAASDEAKPNSEPVSHKFLVDGGIWLPAGMRCGDGTDNFWRFELDGTTGMVPQEAKP